MHPTEARRLIDIELSTSLAFLSALALFAGIALAASAARARSSDILCSGMENTAADEQLQIARVTSDLLAASQAGCGDASQVRSECSLLVRCRTSLQRQRRTNSVCRPRCICFARHNWSSRAGWGCQHSCSCSNGTLSQGLCHMTVHRRCTFIQRPQRRSVILH